MHISGNESKFINIDLILNNIYTGISIGNPPEQILGFFAGKLNTFKIFYYNKTESETINEIKTENDTIIKYSDNFKFNCRNKTYPMSPKYEIIIEIKIVIINIIKYYILYMKNIFYLKSCDYNNINMF